MAALGVGCSESVDTLPFDAGGVGGVGGAGGGATATSGSGGGGLDCSAAADCASLDGPCAKGACVGGTCVAEPAADLSPCEDGLFCTVEDFCAGGACSPGKPRPCDAPDTCSVGSCDEIKDACVSAPGPDGVACDDGDICTSKGACVAGKCVGSDPIDCSGKSGECFVGVCDPAVGCVAEPANEGGACAAKSEDPCVVGQCSGGLCVDVPGNDGAPCDDNVFCTDGESCSNGVCGGGATHDCSSPGLCLVGTCDLASDSCIAVPGNDGDPCIPSDSCMTNATCMGGLCAAGDPAPDGAICDDGLSCTVNEACQAGVCGGGTGVTKVYFAENFSSNQKGWTLGPEWGIGPAAESTGSNFGADPAMDHTPSGDNGVAGVVIGGNASTELHPYFYLESPPFDTTGMGPVMLGFYRWLNSDYAPWMNNTIEVWDGILWHPIWTSDGAPIEDSPPKGTGWTYIAHDITPLRSAETRIRFGFNVDEGGVFIVGSWNIDDVVVAESQCP